MKKYLILISLSLCILFYACTKEKKTTPVVPDNNGPLLGKWYWVDLNLDIYLNNVLQSSGHFLHESNPVRDRFEFRSDGTMLLRDYTANDPDSVYAFSYNAAAQQIIVNRGHGEFHPYNIDTLTTTKLVLTSQDHYATSDGDKRIVTHYSCIKGE